MFKKKFFNFSNLMLISVFIGIVSSFTFMVNKYYFHHNSDYIVSFDDNVSGLDIGSNVMFNGVVVGHVKKITIDHKTEEIDIVVGMNAKLNVSNKIAQIDSQGFTGHKYIALFRNYDVATKDSMVNNEKTQTKNGYIKIKSTSSHMSKLFKQAPEIADQSSAVLRKLSALNMDEINKLVLRANVLLEKMSNTVDQTNNAMKKLDSILHVVDYALQDSKNNLHHLFYYSVPKLSSSIHNIDLILQDSAEILKRFKEKPVKFLLDWYS